MKLFVLRGRRRPRLEQARSSTSLATRQRAGDGRGAPEKRNLWRAFTGGGRGVLAGPVAGGRRQEMELVAGGCGDWDGAQGWRRSQPVGGGGIDGRLRTWRRIR